MYLPTLLANKHNNVLYTGVTNDLYRRCFKNYATAGGSLALLGMIWELTNESIKSAIFNRKTGAESFISAHERITG
ncbi:hypothetical protein LEWO105114_00085 [Legionella worsleiensis]|uniref:Uncharacterized protein n=1 Tax=Legionella worsleiensis TaxID=45076 RepID=A0A0W1AEB2_9GAMM|nr:hypothetical protein Lwor_1171 [Legionella worsleiensis]STY32167.1 Uncharacterised protein [Legionella worsleiensis]